MESPEEEPQSLSFNITAHESSVYNASGSGTFNFNQQRQPTERAQQQKENVESILNLEHSADRESGKEKNDEEDKIPSDLSIDHHSNRTCEYTLTFTGSDEGGENRGATEFENIWDETKWMLDGVCISNLCFSFKEETLNLAQRIDPSQLSDSRFLTLNNIYMFDKNITSSISKYFASKVRTLLKPTLSFDTYLPTRGIKCYEQCFEIEMSPPVD